MSLAHAAFILVALCSSTIFMEDGKMDNRGSLGFVLLIARKSYLEEVMFAREIKM